ncbi:N-terminal double-transmembrane domain-containing protein [Algoriphagus locisalis]|uniref:N-terminal double-transmembrane domain-containing protein n=1 Tax=Algoriphagus locisalis TaxID=305507 RepID=A0A1I7BR69_9BACT|nr:BatA domain-containing protein [Algoriphagus locisalis]SFT89705.1 N-terminal double-transmembrane domain-containing protein [Algoriphagus locisalis]
MQFLQPILLWGLLGISIPFLIHLWRGKKGTLLSWAAMHWLPTQESSVANGIRLENILVLILRILMLVLLVFLLSQLFLPKLNEAAEARIIHLVQPSNQVTEEYRFEIQQALEKGEEVFWADDVLSPIESMEELNSTQKKLSLQGSLDQVPSEATELNLYLSNSKNAFGAAFFLSKIKPKLHLGSSELGKSQPQSLALDGGKVLQANKQGLLDSLPKGQDMTSSMSLGKEQFGYFLAEGNSSERVVIQAAFEAINEVYGFEFVEKEQVEKAKLVFDSELPAESRGDKLYFISGNHSFSEQANLLTYSDRLDFEASEQVQTGRLPELILEEFLAFSGIEQQDVKLSYAQVERRFLVQSDKSQSKKANLNLLLLGLFLGCFAAERYFANQQGI